MVGFSLTRCSQALGPQKKGLLSASGKHLIVLDFNSEFYVISKFSQMNLKNSGVSVFRKKKERYLVWTSCGLGATLAEAGEGRWSSHFFVIFYHKHSRAYTSIPRPLEIMGLQKIRGLWIVSCFLCYNAAWNIKQIHLYKASVLQGST